MPTGNNNHLRLILSWDFPASVAIAPAAALQGIFYADRSPIVAKTMIERFHQLRVGLVSVGIEKT